MVSARDPGRDEARAAGSRQASVGETLCPRAAVPARRPPVSVKSITALNWGRGRPDAHDMAEQARGRTGVATTVGRTVQQRRRHPRVAVAGKIRMVADTSQGLVTLSGTVTD